MIRKIWKTRLMDGKTSSSLLYKKEDMKSLFLVIALLFCMFIRLEIMNSFFASCLLLFGICTLLLLLLTDQEKPFCIVEVPQDGQPIVFKYRNNDLYLYKPDYAEEEELVSSMLFLLFVECKDVYHFSFRNKVYGDQCKRYSIVLLSDLSYRVNWCLLLMKVVCTKSVSNCHVLFPMSFGSMVILW